MVNILKDNKGNAVRIETCKYCTDFRGKPKLILPEDMSRVIRMPDGSYKCEPCQIEEIQNKIVKEEIQVKQCGLAGYILNTIRAISFQERNVSDATIYINIK
jgi:hypothetical protein